MNREKQLRKEIEEREKLGVSEEYTGHWSYDDYLKAELKGILFERKRILKLIDEMLKKMPRKDVAYSIDWNDAMKLKELKKEIEDGR